MKRACLYMIALICLAGCEEETVVPGKDRMALLTELPWKLVAEYQRLGALPAWGSNSYFPSPCEADNEYRFTTAGDYLITEGPSKCLPAQPDTLLAGRWAFIQSNSISIGTVTHLLERLDDNNLVMVFPRQTGGREIQVRWVFVH